MRQISIAVLLASLSLAACNSGSGDGGASQRQEDARGLAQDGRVSAPGPDATTGAGGAVTGAADPNPTGAGATTGATPGDPSGSMGSTSPVPPTSPAQSQQPMNPPPK